jgi:hypothetical protein
MLTPTVPIAVLEKFKATLKNRGIVDLVVVSPYIHVWFELDAIKIQSDESEITNKLKELA